MLALTVALVLVAAPQAAIEDIAKTREQARPQLFEWQTWSAETFAKAKAEKKVLLVDCAAEWCHWCHVMDEATYRDPQVGAWLRDHAVAIRVDIDERPDLADRYNEWGWPATVLLSSEAQELGKFRGYLAPERMLNILTTLDAAQTTEATPEPKGRPVGELKAAVKQAEAQLEALWDAKEGGWGIKRKVPIGMNVTWSLSKRDPVSLKRADFTLSKQRALIDPVWGGLSQYSAARTWKEPHFEKLLSFQAANLEAYALGFQATKAKRHLADATAIFGFVTRFMTSPEGTFYVNQDADVNAHDRSKPFVDGHTYYALGEKQRLALGTPWVDTHVYASENGKMVSALVSLGTPQALASAKKAADALEKSHVLPDGTVKHEASSSSDGPFFLEDAAALGFAYARLAEATGDERYHALATKLAARLVEHFSDGDGAMFDATVDRDAVGVFAHRTHAFVPNVWAARLLGKTGHQREARQVLAGIAAPERIEGERAFLGDFLLAAAAVK